MKNKSLIAVIFILVAVVALALTVYPTLAEKATETTTEAETQASSEQVSISDTVQYQKYTDIRIFDKNGDPVMLSEFEGKPMLINFWATWCGYCIQEMPDFEEAFKAYGDEIQFVIVNTDDGIGNGEKFIADKGYTFPTYYDLEYNAAMTYGISGIPRTIAIDRDGNIRYNRAGMVTAEKLYSIIELIK